MDTKKTILAFSVIAFILLAVLFGFNIMSLIFASLSQTNTSSQTITTSTSSSLVSSNQSITLASQPDTFSLSALNTTWGDYTGTLGSSRTHIDDNINYSLPYTISFWFKKPETVDAIPGFVLCKSDATNNQRAWQFHTNTGNDLLFLSFSNGSNVNITTIQNNNFIASNVWYHIAVTSNGSNVYLYTNGLLTANATTVLGRSFDGTSNVTIGNCQSNAGFWNGSVDELRLYNSQLSYSAITDLYLIDRNRTFNSFDAGAGYFDNFQSYAVGNDTVEPYWIPQYQGYVNITPNHQMLINYPFSQSSDRDLHVAFNRSQVSRGLQNISLQFTYNVTFCNQTFKAGENISNIGASAYLFYADGNNFVSVESKINATTTNCGSGDQAQFTIYKRIAGVTTALNSQSLWTFAMNQTYKVNFTLFQLNATTYNLTGSIDGVLSRSSQNLTVGELQPGQVLLETAGTSTLFSNVNITRTFEVDSPTDYYRFNENQNSTVFDLTGSSSGSSMNVTYNNDSITTIIGASNYVLSGGVFSLSNTLLSYLQIYLTTGYLPSATLIQTSIQSNSLNSLNTYAVGANSQFSILTLSIVMILLLGVFALFWYHFKVKNSSDNKEETITGNFG